MQSVYMDTYAGYGLRENPFTVQALRANDQGRRLMVGRDTEVRLVCQRLHKQGKVTCLDGHIGVGKTSLVNVAAYLCFQAFKEGSSPQLLIPGLDSFQLKKDEDVHDFSLNVF
jgi:hypothetical protein